MSLAPSERVTLIKEIAKCLSVENYSIVDMTLDEFKLPTTDGWSGSKEAYVTQMVTGQDDPKLLGLGKHLGYSVDTSSYLEPSFWTKGKLKVFLSHLSKKKSWTSELQSALLPLGISAFVAHKDIKPTLEWQTQIETALATCDALVALLHNGFHESNWTDQEIGFAMGRGIPVYSVRLGQDPYGFIGKTQAFQGHSKEAVDVAKELFDAYRTDKRTSSKMGETLLEMFADSGSFAQAKTRMGYLEELDTWGADFAQRIREALELNSQISGSWGVSDRVKTISTKVGGLVACSRVDDLILASEVISRIHPTPTRVIIPL